MQATGLSCFLPCRHGMARPQVVDRETASNMEGSIWFMLIMLIYWVHTIRKTHEL